MVCRWTGSGCIRKLRLRRSSSATWLLLLVLMLVTGALAGAAGVGLLALLALLEHKVWTGSTAAGAFAAASPLRRLGAVVVAGVITTVVRLMLRRARAAPGGVLIQLWEQAGIISLGKTVARSILSIVDVGLGAALGREGALKEIGGALASRVALFAKLQLSKRRLLVACGIAAGMASAYNVPVGGALFGLEVLLGRIEIEMVVPMIVCCATATTVSRSLSGNAPTYHIPMYQLGGSVVLAQSLVFGSDTRRNCRAPAQRASWLHQGRGTERAPGAFHAAHRAGRTRPRVALAAAAPGQRLRLGKCSATSRARGLASRDTGAVALRRHCHLQGGPNSRRAIHSHAFDRGPDRWARR
jgi:hypothetical protein